MSPQVKTIIKDIGAGLILRRSSPADADALAAFCADIHSEDPNQPDAFVGAWTRDLLTKPHPRFHADDFTIVEEAATGRIVSTLNLIPQTWSYDGIPFEVGRPELVGTAPEFRNRGLVRLQFEEIHRWSEQRGDLVQGITGIPYYYRLFGYEMVLDLDGARSGFAIHVPQIEAGQNEPCQFRAATPSDIPFITSVVREGHGRYPLACVRDEAVWLYELQGRDPLVANPLVMIEDRQAEPIGVLRYWPQIGKYRGINANVYELKAGSSWLEITPAVIRYMWRVGQELAAKQEQPCTAFSFSLGETHPVYDVFRERLPEIHHSYAWYLRVPDLPRFLRHITPALELRLAGSPACGYTGQPRISFYRSGLRLVFERGRLAGIEPWQPGTREEEGDIAFPGLTFLQLLFGYRSLDELHNTFADCWWKNNETRALFEALFPKKPSQVLCLS